MSPLRWVVALGFVPLSLSAAPAGEFRDLFNGKDLDGWVAEGDKEYKDGDQLKPVWSVKDGLLVCNGKGFGFLRYDKEQFGDFVLHVEYRAAAKCNSGIGIRTTVFDPKKSQATRPSYCSYEIQIYDDAGKPPTKSSTGSLYRYVAPKENATKPAGEWNVFDVECVGPRIKVTLNGKLLIDVDQNTVPDLKDKPPEAKDAPAPKDKPLKGYVCLQNHGGKIEFRNVRLREIKADEKK